MDVCICPVGSRHELDTKECAIVNERMCDTVISYHIIYTWDIVHARKIYSHALVSLPEVVQFPPWQTHIAGM